MKKQKDELKKEKIVPGGKIQEKKFIPKVKSSFGKTADFESHALSDSDYQQESKKASTI